MSDNLTLSAFAEFCESKPADESYYYDDVTRCACGQYASAIGEPRFFYKAIGFNTPQDPFWDKADRLACYFPRTFGALATRLRSALETKP